jgi:hypothetical protein
MLVLYCLQPIEQVESLVDELPIRILLQDFVADFPFKNKEKKYSKKLALSTLFPKENYQVLSLEEIHPNNRTEVKNSTIKYT